LFDEYKALKKKVVELKKKLVKEDAKYHKARDEMKGKKKMET
jgi:hypothetical protein